MKKELMWFQQNFPIDIVRYNVLVSGDGNKPPYGFDYSAANADILALAIARGRPTWDESDIIQYHATRNAEIITLPVAPVQEQEATV